MEINKLETLDLEEFDKYSRLLADFLNLNRVPTSMAIMTMLCNSIVISIKSGIPKEALKEALIKAIENEYDNGKHSQIKK